MDLSGLRYLKSSGYQVLFELVEKSQATGIPTALVGPIKEISTIMKIFRLDSLYPMYETLAEAIDDMGDK
jgi:anti-anti-sigma factor